MITEKDKAAILKLAKKYNLSAVILFGSCLDREDPNDIDIGIKGIEPEVFFKFYGELLLEIHHHLFEAGEYEQASGNRRTFVDTWTS